ncbi:putative DNA glycosylase At3g47830 isoform X2 [Ananas comosus]|uniref:DNA glycosylase At3g47830 isoform X2 n=1 Tax=Ananas comosus TaxID=4615 RepID=A0A6P5F2E4_ANACO|nr:putative DNA glycosylase At3g47830 isoform X2 [Ananas comosus]
MPRNPKRKLLPPPDPRNPPPEPYPEHPLPTPDQCRVVRDSLLAFHGFPDEFAKYRRNPNGSPPPVEETVLDGLVITLLSQNTTDSNSRRAFDSLKSTFPSWNQVDAESKLLEDAIRCGGLAATKAARIKSIMRSVMEKRGEICLEYLRSLSIDEVKAELSQFKGIGPKTVACVLMFYLQKDDFPVDTHVFRITKAMSWIPTKANREKAYLHLNRRIPNDLKFDLNCLFVTHGKLCKICTRTVSKKQTDDSIALCPLTSYCCVDELQE